MFIIKALASLTVIFIFIMLVVFILGIIISIFQAFGDAVNEVRGVNLNIEAVDELNGYEFEDFLNSLFLKLNYKAYTTSKSGDFGADLLIEDKTTKKKIVIQAKRYKQNVGLAAVQEVHAAKAYYQADEAWVVTNSGYTKSAIELANNCNVKLIDRSGLIKLMHKASKNKEDVE